MKMLSTRRKRLLISALGVVAIAGLAFALGSLSRANEASATVDPAFAQMLRSRDTAAVAGNADRPAMGTAEKAGASPAIGTPAIAPAPMQTCSAPLALAITDGTVALSSTGITPRQPGAAFELTGLTVRAEGECDSAGKPKDPRPVLETSWMHRESSMALTVRQSPAAATPPGNFLGQGMAVFTDGGYDFTVSLGGYALIQIDNGAVVKPMTGAAEPAIAPDRQAVPAQQAEAVLAAAVQDLAPGFPAQCFAREVAGDWPDAVRLGVGDPRPALPSGYADQGASIRYVQPAAAGCATPGRQVAGGGLQLSANYSDGKGALNISAYAVGAGAEGPGWANDYGLSWSRNGIQYSLNGSRDGQGIGLDVLLRKIAGAMDGGFASACLIGQREISEDDLSGLGYRAAKAPSGWTLIRDGGTSAAPSSGCSSAQSQDYGGVSYSWTFARATSAIDVSLNRYGPRTSGSMGGFIADNYLNWNDGKGTMYSISSWGMNGKGSAEKDDLIALAKSIDPSFDASKLTEEKGGIAIDGGSGGVSSGSSGSSAPMPPTR